MGVLFGLPFCFFRLNVISLVSLVILWHHTLGFWRFNFFLFVCFRYQSSRFAIVFGEGGCISCCCLLSFYCLFLRAIICTSLFVHLVGVPTCSFCFGGLSFFGKSVTPAVEGGVGVPHQYLWVSYSLPLQMLQDVAIRRLLHP